VPATGAQGADTRRATAYRPVQPASPNGGPGSGGPGSDGPLGRVPPTVLILSGGISVQIGAGLAARLFTQLPAAAVTGLRLWAAALIIAAIGGRNLAPVIRGPGHAARRPAAAGLTGRHIPRGRD
jgi:hypothetical protein